MTNTAMRYIGLEIVRLKQDHPDEDLKAGDCGVVWGVYGTETGPYSYEATFTNERGEAFDIMFDDEDVEEVTADEVVQTTHPERLLETVQIFRSAAYPPGQAPDNSAGGSEPFSRRDMA